MPNTKMQKAALVAVGAMALTACGGGGSDNAGPDGGAGAVNAFAYTQPIAGSRALSNHILWRTAYRREGG